MSSHFYPRSFSKNRFILLCIGIIAGQCVPLLHAENPSTLSSAPAELRGIMVLPSAMQFSLRERESGQHFWLRIGQERQGIRLEAYDPDTQLLKVSYQGQDFEIGLEDASDEPMPTIATERVETARMKPVTPIERERNRPRLSISPRRASVAVHQPVADARHTHSAPTDGDSWAAILAQHDKLPEKDSRPAHTIAPRSSAANFINPLDYPVAPRAVSNLESLPKKNK